MTMKLSLGGLIELLSTVTDEISRGGVRKFIDLSRVLTDGDEIDEIDVGYAQRRTLAATTEELDLVGGLTDINGDAFDFAKLKLLVVHNRSIVAGENLIVGGATNAVGIFSDASDKMPIGPNGFLIWGNPSLAGVAVAGGSTDKLKFDSGAATITYDVLMAGVRA